MKWTGGCLCGEIRYEINAIPGKNSGYCHCRMCQKAYGNGFSCFLEFPASGFKFLQGEPVIYRASNVGERGFCKQCGSPMVMYYSSLPDSVWIYVGTLDSPNEAERYMVSHVCVESEIPWLTIHDNLERVRSDEVAVYAKAGLDLETDNN